jgi:hydroxymethylbilane synthase
VGRALRLGTRGSRLALRQSRIVAERLRALGVHVELVTIVSDGDLRAPDAAIGEGVFVTALERALTAGEIDLAVHSAKDLPLEENPLTVVVAYPERADPRDAMVARGSERSLADLPPGSRVGTDSPRRAGFVRALRPDVEVIALHGNVDTRLQRLDAGQADALVLAAAGLDRLGFGDRAIRLDPETMPPAPAQGALAVQVRRADEETASLVAPLDDAGVRSAVVAERALLKAMGGGCRAPVGAVASAADGTLTMIAGAAMPDGRARHVLRRQFSADPARVAAAINKAAADLNRRVRIGARALLDTRPDADPAFKASVEAMGFRHVHAPAIAIEPAPAGELERARDALGTYDWVVVTSRRGVDALLPTGSVPPPGLRWAAVGESTAAALAARGVQADCVPGAATADAIPAAMAALGPLGGSRVLLARADAAGAELPAALRAMGASVDDVIAYRTVVGPKSEEPGLLAALADPQLEVVVFASGSAVRGVATVARAGLGDAALQKLKIITIGPKTSAVARDHGLTVTRESATRDGDGLAAALRAVVEEEVERWLESQTPQPA